MKFLTAQWLDHYVKGEGDGAGRQLHLLPDRRLRRRSTGGWWPPAYRTADYPGVAGDARREVAVAGPAQPIANPPDGNPAAISSLPVRRRRWLAARTAWPRDMPGQHARFDSAPLAEAVDVVGSPTVQIRAASPTGEAVLFVKLYDVDPDGAATLPDGLVAPVRLTGLPQTVDAAAPVTVTLPAIVRRVEAGHRLRLVVATSDQAYATPAEPTVYTVAVGGGAVTPADGGRRADPHRRDDLALGAGRAARRDRGRARRGRR